MPLLVEQVQATIVRIDKELKTLDDKMLTIKSDTENELKAMAQEYLDLKLNTEAIENTENFINEFTRMHYARALSQKKIALKTAQERYQGMKSELELAIAGLNPCPPVMHTDTAHVSTQ